MQRADHGGDSPRITAAHNAFVYTAMAFWLVAVVRRLGLAVRRWAGKPKDLGSIPLRLSFLFKKVVVCGHCFVHHFLLEH